MRVWVLAITLTAVALTGACAPSEVAEDPRELGTVSQALYVEQKLKPSDGAAGYVFSSSSAIDGNTAVFGSYSDDSAGANAGSAYVFQRTGTTWAEQQKLLGSDIAASDQEGRCVVISGDTVIVGAPYDDTAAGDSVGSAYVFTRAGTVWSEQQKLTPSDGAANNYFGSEIALVDDTALLSSASGTAGSVYAFERTGTVWAERQKIQPTPGQASSQFGSSIDFTDQGIAIIGAPQEDVPLDREGAAYVFQRTGTTWAQQQRLTASDKAQLDVFGGAVEVDGTTAFVGAGNARAAYVFERSGTTWTETDILSASDGASAASFGTAISIDGPLAAIGAYNATAGGTTPGAVYVFEQSGGLWSETDKLWPSDAAFLDNFGFSVGVSGATILISSHADDDNGTSSGSAYVFTADANRPNGTPCADGAQCISAFCVDGTCCDSACTGANDYCSTGSCLAKLGLGGGCSANGDCVSDLCVDGVCCDSACTGPCLSCLGAHQSGGADGLCGPVQSGLDPKGDCVDEGASSCGQDGQCDGSGACRLYGASTACGATTCSGNVVSGQICDGSGSCVADPSGTDCAPYVCSGGACANPCSSTANCTAGHYCAGGTCVPTLSDGSTCTLGAQCTSTHCVESVCCNSACNLGCTSCLAANKATGPNGVCGNVTSGTDPRNSCPVDSTSSCDRDGLCNGSGTCRIYAAGVSCGPNVCSSNQVTGQVCDGSGTCIVDSIGTDCAPYTCSGGACESPCAGNADCVAGYFCNAGTCSPVQGNGAICDQSSDCASNQCVEGVCCENACTAACTSCLAVNKASGTDGLCGPTRAGLDPRASCTAAGAATCGQDGQCDGSGGCRLHAAGVSCGATACSGNLVSGLVCNGSGACITDSTGTDCAPYVCTGGSCANPCTVNTHCLTGYFCDSGTCNPLLSNGASCDQASDCSSNSCVEGVCCENACAGTCVSCRASNKASGADGFCGLVRDGIDPRGSCTDAGAPSCGLDGQCNGSGGCRLYGSGVACGATSCSTNLVTGRVCDGVGTCVDSAGTDCAPYLCASGACANPCASDASCVAGHYCDQGTCRPREALGVPCTSPSECVSGSCVQGVCCSSTCGDTCVSCLEADKAEGLDGECGPVRDGIDPRNSCPDDGAATCGRDGQCDGDGACGVYRPGAACGTTSCNGNRVAGEICDGTGTCTTSSLGVECAPFACVGTSCVSVCADDGECAADHFCDVGACLATLALGDPCQRSSQCAAAECVASVCGGPGAVSDAGSSGGAPGTGGGAAVAGGSGGSSSGAGGDPLRDSGAGSSAGGNGTGASPADPSAAGAAGGGPSADGDRGVGETSSYYACSVESPHRSSRSSAPTLVGFAVALGLAGRRRTRPRGAAAAATSRKTL